LGGGGLGDLMKGGLGGLLAGGAAGSILSGGLGDLLKQFQEKGQGDAANSWVSNGPNKQIAPAISPARSAPIRSIRWPRKADCPSDELLKGLSQYLPDVINHLTPDGRLPNEHELFRPALICIPRRGLRRGLLPLDIRRGP